MKVLIHACPKRLWYVTGFLVPQLKEQGADEVEVWNDTDRLGNLEACMKSFATRQGDGGTWHIQDDVLLCRNFVQRCSEMDQGVVYGFTCGRFGDDVDQTGRVYAPDVWHSFQCVRIPDAYARECAEWFYSGVWRKTASPELYALYDMGQGDDSFFREFLQTMHGTETMINVRPNLVEHVDWIIGGSILSPYREYYATSHYWDDVELVEKLKKDVEGRMQH